MSIISYFGGKANFQSFITPIIPKDCKTYVEPFSGSFAIYLDSKLEFENVIFNDRNRHQANLMQCCSRPEEFLVELKKLMDFGGLLYTTETELDKKWDFYKAIYRTYITNDFLDNMDFEIGDLEVGAIYAFLITSSFSSVYPRGGGFTGFKKKTNKLNLQILINKLEKNKYTERLQNINEFNNLDFEEVITMHDAEDTYMYLDPPYARFNDIKNDDDGRRLFWYGCDTENTFGVSSHRRLLELLKKSKCRWSLSYYYFPLLEELLPKDEYFWTSKEFHRPSAVIKNKVEGVDKEKGIELLIMNYNPETGEKINANSNVQQSEPEWNPFGN
jgi:site-specific DNA-adenine methylase